MFDVLTGWSRLMAVGVSMTETSLRAFETLGASNEVIAARTAIIGAAIRSPFTGDHAELGRMMPEKVDAFSRAGSATVAAWWTAQSAWMEQMHHMGRIVIRSRPASPAELADLGDRMATLTLESIEATARLGSTALAPVHSKATANARRLKHKPARGAFPAGGPVHQGIGAISGDETLDPVASRL